MSRSIMSLVATRDTRTFFEGRMTCLLLQLRVQLETYRILFIDGNELYRSGVSYPRQWMDT